MDRPDRHRPGGRRRRRADHRRPGGRRAVRSPRGIRRHARARGSADVFRRRLLAAAAFIAMLQLSLVCEGWPLGGLELRWSGLAALALSWAAGTGAYFLFVNLGAVPAAGPPGRRRPARPRRSHLRPGLRRRAHRGRLVANAVVHRPARLARQHDHPPPAPAAGRQRPRHRPRRADLPGAPRRRALAACSASAPPAGASSAPPWSWPCCSKAGRPRGCPPPRAGP